MESFTNQTFWKSIDEKYQTDEWRKIAENEFLNSPYSENEGGTNRRDFLKLMGASIALASTSCVRRPVEHIIPYANKPPEITPGVANFYASSYAHSGVGFGTLVKTREGRPIKLEGNPSHPMNQGGLSALAQAQVLGVYDPDRVKNPAKQNENGNFEKITWDELDEQVHKQLRSGGAVLLTSSLASPTTAMAIKDFFAGFNGRHVVWDPIGADDIKAGQNESYGQSVVPRYRFDKAQMIVSVGCDFMGSWISSVEHMRDFSKGRKANAKMNKLVVFEPSMTLTGANADTRLMVKASQQLDVVMGLLHEIVVKQKASRYAGDGQVADALTGFGDVAKDLGVEPELFSEIAKDLWKNKGASLVVAGGLSGRTEDSLALQIAVNFLNTVLENDGETVDGTSTTVQSFEGSYAAMKELVADMNAGRVKTLIINKVNPVYSLAKKFGFEEALAKVQMVIYMGHYEDETARFSHYLAPDHHHLENWGDLELQKGVYSIQQPTIRPLYDTRSMQLSLISWAYQAEVGPARLKDVDSWLDYLKNAWKQKQSEVGGSGNFEQFWANFLKEGVIDTSSRGGRRNQSVTGRKFLVSSLKKIGKTKLQNSTELVLYASIGHHDGSFANLAWLQEFPDPVTKLCWDSYLMVSPDKAAEMKLRDGDIVEVKTSTDSVTVPAFVQPGMHSEVVALAVGLGRTHAGEVGSNIGVNAFNLVQSTQGQPVFSAISCTISKTGKRQELANTQGHQWMEGRQIVVQATLADYLKKADANIHKHKVFSIWPKHEYKGYRWAMSIDLNTCTGCSACVIACQAENNIASVGRRLTIEGREMHWLRIDRYYVGSEKDPAVVFQPMLCQHCENAPCETVCPVLATTHSDEGLNQMTYNRCVGTRYCSNNCPYKVRRFNWFAYDSYKKPANLVLNPDVSVRSRGVMEKCTFCVQRIHVGKNIAKDEGRLVKDGEIKTACQESCPTQAITFGNINDPESKVGKEHSQGNSYGVLEEYNTVPMVKYRTKIRNTDKLVSDHHEGAHS